MNTTLHSLAARILAVRLFICACFIACISSCASTHELTATQQVVFGPSRASPAMNGSKVVDDNYRGRLTTTMLAG